MGFFFGGALIPNDPASARNILEISKRLRLQLSNLCPSVKFLLGFYKFRGSLSSSLAKNWCANQENFLGGVLLAVNLEIPKFSVKFESEELIEIPICSVSCLTVNPQSKAKIIFSTISSFCRR